MNCSLETKKNRCCAILIPALNPTDTLVNYVHSLIQNGFRQIILVNDGSTAACDIIFRQCEAFPECTVLKHSVNLGKGRALKTGFQAYLQQVNPTLKGVITADADGQHLVKDVILLDEAMDTSTEHCILGVRNFKKAGIPFRSRFGNVCTSAVFKVLYGSSVKDTQTGLRALSNTFIEEIIKLPGDRFEYEINMLIAAALKKKKICQIDIHTIYENNNEQSHFRPVRDSIKIYSCLMRSFLRYTFSSLSAAVLDLLLFFLFSFLFQNFLSEGMQILLATAAARVLSSLYNYFVNKNFVFQNKSKHQRSIFKYYLLCIFQMLCSAFAVWGIHMLLPLNKVVIKAIVDLLLFIISYQIQQRFIFSAKK